MRDTIEIIFDITYLISVITMGIIMIVKSEKRSEIKLFGIMAVILGVGDAFHLVPRVYALSTDGLENHYALLGFGKFVTSITMTIFYVILYHIAQKRYDLKNRGITYLIYFLAIFRVLLCLCPKDEWLSANPPLAWGIYRNIPFLILGIVIIVLFFREAGKRKDQAMKWMWLAITLSFAFYIPVVIWAESVPPVGALMIPKTIAYVWIVTMGLKAMKEPSPNRLAS